MTDKRKFNGGRRPGSGPKKKDPMDKKVQMYFMVKRRYADTMRRALQQQVDEINKK